MPEERLHSCLYAGTIVHQRFGAIKHRLAYKVVSLLVDLDELDQLDRFRLFSVGRFNLFSFYPSDLGPRDGTDLKAWAGGHMTEAGLAVPHRIRILCFPRMFGQVFNPLSIWFCHDEREKLTALLYEVGNTFGEHHTYFIPTDASAGVQRHGCEKDFHVSPFFDVAGQYQFRVAPPDHRLSIMIRYDVGKDRQLVATQTGERVEIGDGALLRQFPSHPHLTAKVVSGIHWEAARLWWKGAKYRPKPPPPANVVDIVHQPGSEDIKPAPPVPAQAAE